MKLLLVGPGHPFRGGIAFFTHALADELGRDGEIESLWVGLERQYPRFLFPGASDRQEGGQLATFRPPDARWDPWNPASAGRIADRAARFGATVALFPWWTWVWTASDRWLFRALRKRGIRRVVAIVHNFSDHEAAAWKRASARFALAPADAFLTHSEAIAAPLRSAFPGRRCEVAPLPLHRLPGDRALDRAEARRLLGLPGDGPVFLFFGLVRPYKGLDLLLDAWPAIRQATGGALLVAGEFWPETRALLARARALAPEGVRLREGFVPDGEVAPLFRAADLVVLPYRAATGSGIVPIAEWFGRPVLATDIAGLRDVVTDEVDGILVPPGDAAAVAGGAIRFVREGLGPAMEEAALRAGERHSWQHYVAILKKVANPD